MRLHLSPRKIELLDLLVCGLSYKQIASIMGIKRNTVKASCHSLLIQTGMSNQIELALWWQAHEAELKDALLADMEES